MMRPATKRATTAARSRRMMPPTYGHPTQYAVRLSFLHSLSNTRISGGAPICRRRPLHPVVLRPLGPWPYVVCSIVLQTRHMDPARSLLFIPEEGGVARRLQALASDVHPPNHHSHH